MRAHACCLVFLFLAEILFPACRTQEKEQEYSPECRFSQYTLKEFSLTSVIKGAEGSRVRFTSKDHTVIEVREGDLVGKECALVFYIDERTATVTLLKKNNEKILYSLPVIKFPVTN